MSDLTIDIGEDHEPSASSQSPTIIVIPPLNSLRIKKQAQLSTKSKGKRKRFDDDGPTSKAPRPLKLKPLREVLKRLITVIKKKDDYAFFLKPVNAHDVLGYADIVKEPMDFGTVEKKVENGKYRKLDEFTTDIRLVTCNAKLFNPPDSLYYSEAVKIEEFSLLQIERAAPSVIEYETIWDFDAPAESGLGGQSEEPGADHERLSAHAGESSRREQRGASKKVDKTNNLPLIVDPDGGLPGSLEGLGHFPYQSDLQNIVTSFKLKGRKHMTKRERIRYDKGNQLVCQDGSVDFARLDDPMEVLLRLLPDSLPWPHPVSVLQGSDEAKPKTSTIPAQYFSQPLSNSSRKHLILNRAAQRQKGQDWYQESSLTRQIPRSHNACDYGRFAMLAGELAQADDVSLDTYIRDQALMARLRAEVPQQIGVRPDDSLSQSAGEKQIASKFIQDVLFGGRDGMAYWCSVEDYLTSEAGPSSLSSYVKTQLLESLSVSTAISALCPVSDPSLRASAITDNHDELASAETFWAAQLQSQSLPSSTSDTWTSGERLLARQTAIRSVLIDNAVKMTAIVEARGEPVATTGENKDDLRTTEKDASALASLKDSLIAIVSLLEQASQSGRVR